MNRSFVRSTLDAGSKASAYKITCRQCGKTDKIGSGSHSGTLPDEMISKKFRHKGWAVGNKTGDDVCEDCVKATKLARKTGLKMIKLQDLTPENLASLGLSAPSAETGQAPQKANPDGPLPGEIRAVEAVRMRWISESSIYRLEAAGKLGVRHGPNRKTYLWLDDLKNIYGEPGKIRTRRSKIEIDIANRQLNEGKIEMNIKAETPPEMTKEDRRIIFSEIDSHYLDETRGYDRDWNDERVAKGLNVPLAWVRGIREDNFGPERGDAITVEVEKLVAAKADIDAAITKMRDLWTEINKSLEAFTIKQNDLSAEAKKAHATAEMMLAKIDSFTRK